MTKSFTDVFGELAFAQLWQVTLVIAAAAIVTRLICRATGPFGAPRLARGPDQVPHAATLEQPDRCLQLGDAPIDCRCQERGSDRDVQGDGGGRTGRDFA